MRQPTASRRRVLQGGLATAATVGLMAHTRPAFAYPTRNFNVTIPTGQGGGAERLARAFDGPWSAMLGRPFEYEFFPGAGGQVGYELFVNRRPADGHHLLFGNMGPEMIMYALQRPNYTFPDDYIYFCRLDIDDSCVFVRADSPIQSIEQLVDMAKQRRLNIGTSRIPHPASIGLLALGDATGAQFNLVPYGGGNPTYIGTINGEVEASVLPITGVISQGERFRILGIFNPNQSVFGAYTDAPLVNDVFGTNLPDLASSRSWAIHTRWADENPEHFAMLEDTSRRVFDDAAFAQAFEQTGAPVEALAYGDRELCTNYALAMIELTERYRDVLSAGN
ncbi:MAG: hypothetical protein EA356_18095 [Geminicoccaceae bacterium]|nr:MAG: hypothetical protein EA356_18095 [Geminicoccaceae bacterium]